MLRRRKSSVDSVTEKHTSLVDIGLHVATPESFPFFSLEQQPNTTVTDFEVTFRYQRCDHRKTGLITISMIHKRLWLWIRMIWIEAIGVQSRRNLITNTKSFLLIHPYLELSNYYYSLGNKFESINLISVNWNGLWSGNFSRPKTIQT